MIRIGLLLCVVVLAMAPAGCATQKESHTARTGVEQLLISSAVDKSLDQFDYSAMGNKKVFLETKYLECVDKNYILLSLRHRILKGNGRLVDKADGADLIVEVGSGGVGTDGQELFIGIPEIPLPPPSPIAIPRLSLLTRTKMNGTAKLLIVAYDAKTKTPVYPFGSNLARSDQNNWNVLGMGPMQSGSVTREIADISPEPDLSVTSVAHYATKALTSPTAAASPERQATHQVPSSQPATIGSGPGKERTLP